MVKVLEADVAECEAEEVVVGPTVPVVEHFPAGHFFMGLGSAALGDRNKVWVIVEGENFYE